MARIFIGNIKGPQGERGPQGEQGPVGPQGPQGPLPPLVNNALATEAGVSALDAAMGKTLQDQITDNKDDITQLYSNFKFIYTITETIVFSSGKATVTKDISTIFSRVGSVFVMGLGTEEAMVCSATDGALDKYTIKISNVSVPSSNNSRSVGITYIGEKISQ